MLQDCRALDAESAPKEEADRLSPFRISSLWKKKDPATRLTPGGLLAVENPGEVAVHCRYGSAWLSVEGRFDNPQLQAGESIELRSRGKLIVVAGAGGAWVRVDKK